MFYVLSDAAEEDIDGIFEFSVSEFGMEKAISYYIGLTNLFVELTNFPEEGNLEMR